MKIMKFWPFYLFKSGTFQQDPFQYYFPNPFSNRRCWELNLDPPPCVLNLSWFNYKSMFSLRWELFVVCSLPGIPWQGFCLVPGHDCVPFNPKLWGRRRTWRGRWWANSKQKNTREKIKGWKQVRYRSCTIWCCKGEHRNSYLNNSLLHCYIE